VVARARLRAVAVAALTTLAGCASSSQLIPTQPSAVTQQVVVRSLERALIIVNFTKTDVEDRPPPDPARR